MTETNSPLCCNLACLVGETQSKLQMFVEITRYDWITCLIVQSSYLSHFKEKKKRNYCGESVFCLLGTDSAKV